MSPVATKRRALVPALMLVGCAHGPVRPEWLVPAQRGTAYLSEPPMGPPLTARIMAIALADDDGGRPTDIDAPEIARRVAMANDIYRLAGIHFDFTPAADFQRLDNTTLNNLDVRTDWPRMERLGNEVAARYPDRLVVFFRHGAGTDATGAGFAGSEYDFVVMPGEASRSCGHEHGAHLAHELGHHLGLSHPYARELWDGQQAAAFMQERGSHDLAIFDGDGFRDTPPDPALDSLACMEVHDLTIDGVPVSLPRRNLMSIYEEADSLTPEQAARARWFLSHRLAHRMKMPSNGGPGLLEAEALTSTPRENCHPFVQDMKPFGVGRYSEDAQVFCPSRTPRPGAFALTVPVEKAGRYRLELYLTQAPDYGIVELTVDGQRLGDPYDAWAPWVMPSGAVAIGERTLAAGKHELVFRTRAKNAQSTAFNLGVDAVGLVAVGGR
jgi:hypothetical protein